MGAIVSWRGPRFDRAAVVRAVAGLLEAEAQSGLRFRSACEVAEQLVCDGVYQQGEQPVLRTMQARLQLCVEEGLLIPRNGGGWEVV